MKLKEDIIKIIDEVNDKIIFYNTNIATHRRLCVNSIILPNDVYFYFTDKTFLYNEYLSGKYPINFKNNILYIFGIKCYRTSKTDKISVEFKYNN